MINQKILIIILVSVILIGGCSKPPARDFDTIEIEYDIISVQLPTIYEKMNVDLSNNGKVILNINKNYDKDEPETKEIKLSSEEINDLRKLVINANVFGLKDYYDFKKGEEIYDTPLYRVNFTINGKSKSIGMALPSLALKELQEVINKLNEIKGRLK